MIYLFVESIFLSLKYLVICGVPNSRPYFSYYSISIHHDRYITKVDNLIQAGNHCNLIITMGIFKLMELLRMNAPDCIRQHDMSYYSGLSIALDASMAMYQFIISTQGYDHNALTSLTDNEDNKTGHLLGLFNRTITLL